MPDKIIPLLPFFAIAKNVQGLDTRKINWTRITEALIIAGVTGMFVSYVLVRELSVEFKNLKETIGTYMKENDNRVSIIENRIYGIIEHENREKH